MYIHIDVSANSRGDSLKQISEGHFLITTRMPPEHNMANARVISLLARHYKIIPSAIRIVSGHHMPRKTISIRDDALETVKIKEKDVKKSPHITKSF